MKKRTSVKLFSDVLERVDRLAGSTLSRSAVIERVLRLYFKQRNRRKMHSHDLERINATAACLNAEVEDVLTYQGLKE